MIWNVQIIVSHHMFCKIYHNNFARENCLLFCYKCNFCIYIFIFLLIIFVNAATGGLSNISFIRHYLNSLNNCKLFLEIVCLTIYSTASYFHLIIRICKPYAVYLINLKELNNKKLQKYIAQVTTHLFYGHSREITG